MELSNYAKIFKALSSEQRLKIFLMIYKNCCGTAGSQKEPGFKMKDKSCCPAREGVEKAFTKICGCMKLSRSTISHHLKQLQNAGLITLEREGQFFRCRVNEEVANGIKDFIK